MPNGWWPFSIGSVDVSKPSQAKASFASEIQDCQHIGITLTSILRPEDHKLRRTGLRTERLRLERSMAVSVLHGHLSIALPTSSLNIGMLVKLKSTYKHACRYHTALRRT